MATKKQMHTLQVYLDRKKEYRWRLLAGNGQIIADSGEGYSRKDNMKRALARLYAAFSDTANNMVIDDQT